jgi:hypothetical protein
MAKRKQAAGKSARRAVAVSQLLAGPIRVSADGRHFVDAEGQPFFWLGDTAWPLLTNYSPEDAEAYLENRARKGFTVVQTIIGWSTDAVMHAGRGKERTPDPNYAGERAWTSDPAQPNEAFFRHVDHLVDRAAEKGLVLAIMPTLGNFVNELDVFNVRNARAYGRWLGTRYKARPNVVWINGGDRVLNGHGAVWRALGQGLREGSGGANLITFHVCGWHSSSQFFHQEDWLDFNLIQTWTEWAKVHPAVTTDGLMVPRKPVVLGEGAYEDGPEYPLGPITPLLVRRQAWWAFMAGGFFTYGQNQMWRMEPGWTGAFDTPGACQMTHFKAVATSRPWWRMVPDQGLFASGVSSERTLNAALRSVDGDCAMAYLSSQCHVLIHLDKILTKRVKATLINPQNGEARDAGTYETGNLVPERFPIPKTQWFSVPGYWEDAVLILDGVD